MNIFEIKLPEDMWISFKNLEDNPDIYKSYINYYNILFKWVVDNQDIIGAETITINRLDTLLKIDPSIYIIDNPEISFKYEPIRMFSNRPETIDTLVMRISNTLWALIKQRSGIDCPQCIDDELNYVIAIIKSTKKKKLIMECDTCGFAQNIDGTAYIDEYADIYPVTKKEIDFYIKNRHF